MLGKKIVRLAATWPVGILRKIFRKRTYKKPQNSNQVTQSGNVANGDIVGRDKQEINQYIFALGPLDIEKLIVFLKANFDRDEDFIRRFLKWEKGGNLHIRSIDEDLRLLETLHSSNLHGSNDQIEKEYDNIVLGKEMRPDNEYVKSKILDAAACVKNLEFNSAHQLVGDALNKINPADTEYNFVYREYLITGFLSYTRKNDINGLRSLLRKKAEVNNEENADIEYIISIIFQEIFSRDTDINSLHEVVSRLNDIYSNANDFIKPAMANSLGLAYRRLGERTGIINLKKAIEIFKEGIELNIGNTTKEKNEIELKDQMAIAYIRIFEFNKDEGQLNIAEVLLKECLKLLDGPMDPRDYRLKPRVLNNIGNIYKQRALIFKDIRSAAKAIAYYEEGEQYWNENNANYDWALLRKNIAETKYALGKLTHDTKILLEALEDCIKAIRYRNLENSPYQWGKTVKIIFQLLILIDELKSIKLIPKSTQRIILSYIKDVITDPTRWSENISTEFVQNAGQAQTLLL